MKKLYILCIFILLNIISNHTNATTNAEALLKDCRSPSSQYCKGYVTGFYDGRTTDDYDMKSLMTCPPTSSDGNKLAISYEQMRLVFINWANNHPEKLHWHDWQAIRQAFAEAWPCKK